VSARQPTASRRHLGGRVASVTRRASSAGAALVLVVGTACSRSDADPSYLRVELAPGALLDAGTGGAPGAAVRIVSDGKPLATYCLNASVLASFDLVRAASESATTRLSLTVTAFDELSGASATQGGVVACPSPLPSPAAPPQTLSVGFCASHAQNLVFNLAANCCGAASDGGTDAGDAGDGGSGDGGIDAADAGTGSSDGGDAGSPSPDAGADAGRGSTSCCAINEVCGAGLSVEGHPCGPTECCPATIADACALPPAN
jgi:hypothetical protein